MTDGHSPQETTRPGPYEAWREFYEINEQAWTKAMKDFYEANEEIWTKTLKDVTSTQWFAEAQGKMLETLLALQKMMRDGTTAQMNALNLPTRDDVARMGELIVSLEEKVDQVEDRLGSMADGLEHRLDERLAKLEKDLPRQVDDRLAKLAEGFPRNLDEQLNKAVDGFLRQLDERLARLEERLGGQKKGG